MITSYKIFENTQIHKFEIPEQIRKYYIIEGDMSNSKNWKSTKYFNPFTLRDEFKESGLGIRYILISLDSNHIIPINMNDEHQVGYDVLENVFYPDYKVPIENYISICSWGTHYIYHIENKEEREQQLLAFKKFLEYGGNSKNMIHFYGTEESKRNDYEMTVDEFLETEGSFKEFQTKIIKSGKISNNGEELIKILEKMTLLWEEYVTTDKERRKEYIQKQLFELAEDFDHFLLMKSNWDGFLNNTDINKHRYKLKGAIDSSNIEELGRILFSHNGIKNFIHMKMKDPKYKKQTKEFFWNVKKAISEFNRLSSI